MQDDKRGMRQGPDDAGRVNAVREQQRLRAPQWQIPEQDKPVRQTMITKIHNLLRLKKPDADEEWLKKLPDMAKRLEDKLYRHAGSMSEYNDDSTLKTRLQQIATEMKSSSTDTRSSSAQPQHRSHQPPPIIPPRMDHMHSQPSASSSPPISSPGTPQFPEPNLSQHSHSNSHHSQQQQHYQSNNHFSNDYSQHPQHQQHHQHAPPPSHQSSSQQMNSQQIQSMNSQQMNSQSMNSQSMNSQPMNSKSMSSSMNSQQGQSSQGQQPSQRDVLRQQQQRLLLLRHASKCPSKPGECRATPHCSQMKTLWKHIATCKEQHCAIPHCVSSRFVLAHYHRCRDTHCDVCEPVRAAIQRGNPPNNNGAGDPQQQQQQNSQSRQPNSSSQMSYQEPPPNSQAQHHGPPPVQNRRPQQGSSQGVPPHQQQQQQSNNNHSMSSQQMHPQPMPPQMPHLSTNDSYNMNDLMAKYIAHWKLISSNAQSARDKQGKYEEAKREERLKDKEAKEAKEQEKLIAQQAENGVRDEVLDAQHRAIRLKYESAKAACKAALLQCQMLEAEVKAMKLQHEKNVEVEKKLQADFAIACGRDQDKVKQCIIYARQQATGSMGSAGGMPPQHHGGQGPQQPPPMNRQLSSSSLPPNSSGNTVATQPVGSVIQKNKNKSAAAGGKEKEKKKPAKELKKQASSSQATPGSYPMTPNEMGEPMGYPPQMQHQMPPHPMPSPRGGQNMMSGMPLHAGMGPQSVSQSAIPKNPPTPKQSATPKPSPVRQNSINSQSTVPRSIPTVQQQIVPPPRPILRSVFREAPMAHRNILDTSLINSFSRKDIESHINSLHRYSKETENAKKTKEVAMNLLKKVQEADAEKLFEYPVDPVRDCAPNYFEIIKDPMDFTTLRTLIENNTIVTLDQFVEKIRLIFSNCLKYNPPNTLYWQAAVNCGRFFEKEYVKYLESEEEKTSSACFNPNNCRLCLGTSFWFEQLAYYCAGPCGRRINRNVAMYSSADNRHWCSNCFQNELPETIQLQDGTSINKRELRKGKHPEPVEEGWVACYCCKRWFHQVCAMLNTKRGQDINKDDFLCPFCVLGYLDHNKQDSLALRSGAEQKKATARDLPETELSKFLEKAVNVRVAQVRREHCEKANLDIRDVEDVCQLSVRVVMAREADVWTRSGIAKIYPKFPKSFNSKQKVLLMFEKLDGVDVLIFIMFLQYYGSDCPAPNARCLYIAYLDSVFYFRPSFLRTAVYHELITSVLDFEKRRGFTRCFIWACPPTGGDDYIFHVHPKNQKTPKPDRLRLWYLTLLEDARQRGIIISLSNLFDEYLSRVSDLNEVPYFEGDCWPTYAEHYIVEMEQKNLDPRARQPRSDAVKIALARKNTVVPAYNDNAMNGSKRQKRAKGVPAKKGRSTSVQLADSADDDMDIVLDTPALNCPLPKPLDTAPLQSLITARIALENDRMKDDFIVVKMYYDCAECAAPMDYPGALYWLPKKYNPEKDPHDYRKRRYAPPYCLCHDCYLSAYQAEYGAKPEYVEPQFPPPEWKEEYESMMNTANNSTSASTASTVSESLTSVSPPVASQKDDEGGHEDAKKSELSATPKRKAGGPGRKRKATGADINELDTVESNIKVLEPGENARPPNPYGSTPPCSLLDMEIQVAMIRPKTTDPDPLIESSIFNVREDFLSLCQGNKYQFDELRRAKHSSMMILFHLHNPDSDAFVHHCNNCRTDILGARYTCSRCSDYDLCHNCHGTVSHPHPLEKHPSSTSSLGNDGEDGDPNAAAMAKAQSQHNVARKQLQMLVHSANCTDVNCQVPNCAKLKKFLDHAPTCSVRISGGCPNCKRYWWFLAYHARQCRAPPGECKVPHCERIKGHIRAQANKTADRRMMALMQRTNQSPVATEEASGTTMQPDQLSLPHSQQAIPPQPPQPPAQAPRYLVSPRGKGGKGSHKPSNPPAL